VQFEGNILNDEAMGKIDKLSFMKRLAISSVVLQASMHRFALLVDFSLEF
jgi:hypothetical protein